MPRLPRTRHLEEGIWKVCPECGLRAWVDEACGRPRRTCSDACRQAAYRKRRRALPDYPQTINEEVIFRG
jgi:hypothetical protein